MKLMGRSLAVAALVLTGGCEVTVNNKSIDNEVEAAASDVGNFAEGAGEALERAGGTVENHAVAFGNKVERFGESVDNRVDINVDLGRRDAPANQQ